MDDRLKELLQQGRELYQKREYAKAEPVLEDVVAREGRFADVFDMLGVIASLRGDLATAEDCFRKAVGLNPNYTEALLNLAVTLNDRRKYDEAREIFERLSTKAPRVAGEIEPFARGKLANMHADLAHAYADMSMRIEAIDELEKAVKLCPTFADLRTDLGLLYRDTGDLARAKAEFLAATEANPRYARAFVLLGSTELAAGDREGARAMWQQALSLEPDNERARSFLAMLDGDLAKATS